MATGTVNWRPVTDLSHVALVLLLVTIDGAPANTTSSAECEPHDAVDCVSHSETYMALPDHRKHTECVNATKTLQCLDNFLSQCLHLKDTNQHFYSRLHEMFLTAENELKDTCQACVPLPSGWTLMTSLVLGLAASWKLSTHV